MLAAFGADSPKAAELAKELDAMRESRRQANPMSVQLRTAERLVTRQRKALEAAKAKAADAAEESRVAQLAFLRCSGSKGGAAEGITRRVGQGDRHDPRAGDSKRSGSGRRTRTQSWREGVHFQLQEGDDCANRLRVQSMGRNHTSAPSPSRMPSATAPNSQSSRGATFAVHCLTNEIHA